MSLNKNIEEDYAKALDKNRRLTKSLQSARDDLRILRAVDRNDARAERFEKKILDAFSKSVKKIVPKPFLNKESLPLYVMPEKGNFVGISDWHIGEDVDSAEVHHSNEFNYKVARQRIKKYVHKIATSNISRSKNLVIADLGDNIRGVIHGGIEDTEDGLMESIVQAVDLQSNFINEMLELYNEIDYRFVVGNHSRLDDQIKAKGKYKDYSWLIVQMLERLYINEPRIKFNISKSGFHMMKVNTANIMLFHGDTFRNYNPHINSSRLQVQDSAISLLGKNARHFFSGHKHIATNIQNQWEGQNIISGTLVGNNEYGVQNGFSSISASQCMFNVQADGLIEEIYHFNLK